MRGVFQAFQKLAPEGRDSLLPSIDVIPQHVLDGAMTLVPSEYVALVKRNHARLKKLRAHLKGELEDYDRPREGNIPIRAIQQAFGKKGYGLARVVRKYNLRVRFSDFMEPGRIVVNYKGSRFGFDAQLNPEHLCIYSLRRGSRAHKLFEAIHGTKPKRSVSLLFAHPKDFENIIPSEDARDTLARIEGYDGVLGSRKVTEALKKVPLKRD